MLKMGKMDYFGAQNQQRVLKIYSLSSSKLYPMAGIKKVKVTEFLRNIFISPKLFFGGVNGTFLGPKMQKY